MNNKRSKPKLLQAILKRVEDRHTNEVGQAPPLSDRQYAWCQHYLQHFNASRASLAVGCKGDPRKHGWRMRHSPAVSRYIDNQLAAHSLSAQIVIAKIAEYTQASMHDFFDEGKFDLKKARERGVLHYIKRLRQTKDVLSIEIVDPLRALWLMAQIHGLVGSRRKAKKAIAGGKVATCDTVFDNLNRKLSREGEGRRKNKELVGCTTKSIVDEAEAFKAKADETQRT